MGRILKAAAHILCGVSLIAISPVKSIAVDAKSSEFSNFSQNRSLAKGSVTPAAAATKLHDIRTGIHSDFTRIVFDSDGARPLSIEPAASNEIAIRYAQLEALCDPTCFSRSYPGAVAKVSHQREAAAGKISITLRQSDTRVKTSILSANPPQNGHYRFIMDFYPTPGPVIKPAEPPAANINQVKTNGNTAGILASAATVPPSPVKKTGPGKAEQSRKIRPLEATSKTTGLTAQLENTRPIEKSSNEESRPTQEIVPLEVPSRPRSAQAPMGLTPSGYTSRYFHAERPRLGLGLSYEFDEDRREGPDTDTKDRSQEFKERLAIETRGWAYHPALLKYTLRFEPEWSQSIEDPDAGSSDRDNVFLPGYFADATILDLKPYTFYLFGSRTESVLRSAFAASSDVTTDSYGGDVRLKYKILPTTFGYTHVDLDQSGFFDRQDVRDDFRLTARNLTGSSNTSLNAIYSDSEQTNEGDTTNLKTSNGTLQNIFDIAGNRKITLNSVLSYRLSDNDFTDSSGVRWNEFLDWRHTDKLRTNYNFTYDRSETGDFDREVTSLGAQLTHLLYENLTTTLGGFATFNDFSGGRENSYEPRLDLLYQRRIPWGNFSLNGGWNYRVTTREGGDTLVPVVDEPQTLTTGVVTLLDNDKVDLNSPIVVTDITGTRVFVEDQDYQLISRDSSVQIERTVFGDIVDGQTVLVDYFFFSDLAFDDALFSQTYGIQFFLWKALTLSYRFQTIDQDILSGPTPTNKVDDTTHAAEIQYDVKWSNTQLIFEDIDSSSRVSSRRWRAQQTFTFRPWRPLFFNLRGFYQQTEFKDRDDTEDFYGLRSRLVWTPARWSRFELEGFHDKVSGDTQERTQTGFNADLNLNYRIWNGNISYDFLKTEDEDSDEKRIKQTLLFEIVRILW